MTPRMSVWARSRSARTSCPDSWLTYAEYAVYGYEDVAEAEFPQLAATAALQILEATHWHAAAARDEASVKALADCQALLISDAALWGSAKASGAVTSVSNDGYAESYAAPAERRREAALRARATIRQALGGPATSWMLYAGGVYHPPARH